MNQITLNPSRVYTRKEVGGPIGLLLDCAFCSFLIVVALGMMAFAFFILLGDYVISPVLALMSNSLRLLQKCPTSPEPMWDSHRFRK